MEALNQAKLAVSIGLESDPLTLARGRFTLLALETVMGDGNSNPASLLTDQDVDVVAQRHSPSLAAAGLLLRVKAQLSGEAPLLACAARDLDSATALMSTEDHIRRIQEMQLAETVIRFAIASSDHGMAQQGLSTLTRLAGENPVWRARLRRAESLVSAASARPKRGQAKRGASAKSLSAIDDGE